MADKRVFAVVMTIALLMSLPTTVEGGPISYAFCMAVVGIVGLFVGQAAIPGTLGFTSSGVAAGSWAASWMATFGGTVPAGSLFATLQSAGAGGITGSAYGGISGFCAALTAPLP